MNYSNWVFASATIPIDKKVVRIEDFGGKGYSKLFLGTKQARVTLSAYGEGNTKVTYQGSEDVFETSDLGMSFVALKSHKTKGWPVHAKYSTIIGLIDGKNIIVEGEYSEARSDMKAKIFFDNSEAWLKALIEYTSGDYDCIWLDPHDDNALNRKYYCIPIQPTFNLPKEKDFHIWSANAATLDFYKEDCRVFGETIHSLFGNNGATGNFSIVNVDLLAPLDNILAPLVDETQIVKGNRRGNPDRSLAGKVAIINSNSDKLYRELIDYEQYEDEQCKGFGLGQCNWSGKEIIDDVMARPAYGFMYQENHNIKGMGFMSYNANPSGAGPYWGTENCKMYSGSEKAYSRTIAEFKCRLTADREDFNFPDDDVFPLAYHALDSNNQLWTTRDRESSRSTIIQLSDGENNFLFHTSIAGNFSMRMQQMNGFEATPEKFHETLDKRLMGGWIPDEGDTIFLSREYHTGMDFDTLRRINVPTFEQINFACNYINDKGELAGRETGFRSQCCWSTYFQKQGSLFTEEEVAFMKAHRSDWYLQVGDVVKNKATGTLHTVKQIGRGYFGVGWGSPMAGHTFEYKGFPTNEEAGSMSWASATAHQTYLFEPKIPVPETASQAEMLVEFEVIKSRGAILKQGGIYDARMSYMSNGDWKQKEENQVLTGSGGIGHGMYNQRELNHDHRNSDLMFYYRENNMNYGQIGHEEYKITDPDTGELVNSRQLLAYAWFGSQHVNCRIPYGQYGGGYDKMFPQHDRLMRSQGITLPEIDVVKQRHIGRVVVGEQENVVGMKVDDPKFYKYSESLEDVKPRPPELVAYINELKASVQ